MAVSPLRTSLYRCISEPTLPETWDIPVLPPRDTLVSTIVRTPTMLHFPALLGLNKTFLRLADTGQLIRISPLAVLAPADVLPRGFQAVWFDQHIQSVRMTATVALHVFSAI